MHPDEFRDSLSERFGEFSQALSTSAGDWVVKGFIDVYKNIYTISGDTKVVSKVVELLVFPILSRFASDHNLRMVLSEEQNHYPDISFVAEDDSKIALDLKSTYRNAENLVNGFTLGAFTGYFRNRQAKKNVTFPYGQYAAHFVLGVIYTRNPDAGDERRTYKLEDLEAISSVVRDFTFLVQEKWKIATDRPGSGNTKNIGSVVRIDDLQQGRGAFAEHGMEVFDDYWSNYLTRDMARAIRSRVPYRNLDEYFRWRKR